MIMYQFTEEPIPPRRGKHDEFIDNWPPGTSHQFPTKSAAISMCKCLKNRGYASSIRLTNQGIKVWKLSKDVAQS